jgi:hypothetical protein
MIWWPPYRDMITNQKNDLTVVRLSNTPLNSLMDSIPNLKMKTMEGKGVGARSLAHSTSRVKGRARVPGWD